MLSPVPGSFPLSLRAEDELPRVEAVDLGVGCDLVCGVPAEVEFHRPPRGAIFGASVDRAMARLNVFVNITINL